MFKFFFIFILFILFFNHIYSLTQSEEYEEKNKYYIPLKTLNDVKDEILWTLKKDFQHFPNDFEELQYNELLKLYDTNFTINLSPNKLYYTIILPFPEYVEYQFNLPISFNRILPNFRHVAVNEFNLTMENYEKKYADKELRWQNIVDHPTQNTPVCIDIFSFGTHGPYWPILEENTSKIIYSKNSIKNPIHDKRNGNYDKTRLNYEILNTQGNEDSITSIDLKNNYYNDLEEFKALKSKEDILPFNTDSSNYYDLNVRHAVSFFQQSRDTYGRGSYVVYGQKGFITPSGHVVFDKTTYIGRDGCETRWFQIERILESYQNDHKISDLFYKTEKNEEKDYYGVNLVTQKMNSLNSNYCKLLNETFYTFADGAPDFYNNYHNGPIIHRYKKVFLATAIWDPNYYHYISDSIARFYGMLDFLQKNEDIMIHFRNGEYYDFNFNWYARDKPSPPIEYENMRMKILKFLKINRSRIVFGFVLADEVFIPRPTRCAFSLSNPYHMNYLASNIFDGVLDHIIENKELSQFLPFYTGFNDIFNINNSPLLTSLKKKKMKAARNSLKNDEERMIQLKEMELKTNELKQDPILSSNSNEIIISDEDLTKIINRSNLKVIEPFSPEFNSTSFFSDFHKFKSASKNKYILLVHRYSAYPDYRNWSDFDFKHIRNAFKKYFPDYKFLYISDRILRSIDNYRKSAMKSGLHLEVDKFFQMDEIEEYFNNLKQNFKKYYDIKSFDNYELEKKYSYYFKKRMELSSEDNFALDILKFLKADIIVTGHGAGLTNLIFSKPNALVVEISGQLDDVVFPVCGYFSNYAAMGGQHHLLYTYSFSKGLHMDYDFLAKETLIYSKALEFKKYNIKNLYGKNHHVFKNNNLRSENVLVEKSFNSKFPFLWYNINNIDYFNHNF